MTTSTKTANIIEIEVDGTTITKTAGRASSMVSAEKNIEIENAATKYTTGTTNYKIWLKKQYDCDNNIHAFYWDDDLDDFECFNPDCEVYLTPGTHNYTYDATTGLYKYDNRYYSTCRAL